MRKLGIRIRKQKGLAAAYRAVEIFDVESGDTIGSFSDCKVSFPVNGAIEVEAKFYPQQVDVIDEVPAVKPMGGAVDVTRHGRAGYSQSVIRDIMHGIKSATT